MFASHFVVAATSPFHHSIYTSRFGLQVLLVLRLALDDVARSVSKLMPTECPPSESCRRCLRERPNTRAPPRFSRGGVFSPVSPFIIGFRLVFCRCESFSCAYIGESEKTAQKLTMKNSRAGFCCGLSSISRSNSRSNVFSLFRRYTREVVFIAGNEGLQRGLIRSGRNRDQRAVTHLGPLLGRTGNVQRPRSNAAFILCPVASLVPQPSKRWQCVYPSALGSNFNEAEDRGRIGFDSEPFVKITRDSTLWNRRPFSSQFGDLRFNCRQF
jgi:hypothetical protein